VSRGSLEKEEKRARVAASPVEEDERDPEGARDAGASLPRARDVDASSPLEEELRSQLGSKKLNGSVI
jgi:hypothetical protein